MILSIIIPCFNEENTILEILNKVNIQKKFFNIQIIISDDGSTDNTISLLKDNPHLYDKLIENKINCGKGAAIISATPYLKGNIIIIQDADLEYDPNDYKNLIQPIISHKCLVVYGSRVLNKRRYKNKNFTSLFRVFSNHVLTIISNLFNRQSLTDAHTCYKVFSEDVFSKILFKEKGFNFCPEATTKISNLGIKIFEVPISYNGRTYKEGKKIKFIDGLEAILTIIKYKFFITK